MRRLEKLYTLQLPLLMIVALFAGGCGGDGGGSGDFLGGNILTGTPTNIQLVLNAGESHLATILTRGGGSMSVYGERTVGGLFLDIEVIETYEASGTRRYVVDTDGRPTFMIDELGNTISLEWTSASTAIVEAIFNSRNGRIQANTVINFNVLTPTANVVPATLQPTAVPVRSRTPSDLQLSAEEAWQLVPGASRQRSNADDVIVGTFRCGGPASSFELVSVRATRRNGDNLGRWPGLPEPELLGGYRVKMPTPTRPVLTLAEICTSASGVLAEPSGAIQAIDSVGVTFQDALCSRIEAAINLLAISQEEKDDVSGRCAELVISHRRAIGVLARAAALDLCSDPLVVGYDASFPEEDASVELFAFTPEAEGPVRIVATEGPWVNLSLTLPSRTEITSFRLVPSSPAPGETYTVTLSVSCVPAETRVFMRVVGSDGYVQDDEFTVTTPEPNGVFSISVPGGAGGVVDVVRARVRLPDGRTLERQASLVFGDLPISGN